MAWRPQILARVFDSLAARSVHSLRLGRVLVGTRARRKLSKNERATRGVVSRREERSFSDRLVDFDVTENSLNGRGVRYPRDRFVVRDRERFSKLVERFRKSR